ncbi:hypothetical protein LTR10_013509 [Elasticomyces elasticus]|uniref:DUF2415 domain-containing protein n=1 Tax=Exophiala sideris TaxID=1016849 RepID=A0ABR0JRF7_9EURO|nr:hypothetical protein LTR10_013509 [Elasticomyces elasticus]KAK5039647.1 hypothetical protein LTS07_000141 [Exophiala sideris]KAK5041199.1 hypothetical protein LTR13_002673 [Exophiala sideris]KAK5068024.1 hypothetical protein LTR69_000141 [Exophiala sideris]KAK5187326.1 hypothetical protein LTR44_000141 [Eurotiomycetes sp. CCFEE 6388]
MTATDREQCLTPTQGLAKASKFYPAKISIPHHQLRHYISTSDGNLIYYVTNYDVFVLNLETQQSSLLATIPFEARCLAADSGWVCVGGEMNGDCAFIKVEKDEHGHPKCFGHDLVVDVLGGEIVNSMNIHTIKSPKAPDEPIVLISNNDKSIKIYSLAQRQVLTTLSHQQPMNFAAMSPDSEIIAAVGDSDKVHFYQRHLDRWPEDGYAKFDWLPFAEVAVPTGDPVYDDYSFAVAFSPSGHLCASSSQGGSIIVFDMERLVHSDKDPGSSILCTFRSSRPTLWGCVRAMAFSPAPWDILAWAEDHGRIGLADVRLCFMRRQVLELDSHKVETVDLEDGTPVTYRNLGVKERLKQQHLARLRAIRGSTPSGTESETNNEETETARRYTRQDLLSYHQGLDLNARERSVIDALETTMDNVEQSATQPFSINYRSSPQPREDQLLGYNIDPLAPLRGSQGNRSHAPRRRTSVVLSESSSNSTQLLDPNNNERTRLSTSPGRIGEDEQPSTRSPMPPVHTSRVMSSNIPPSDPWHVIQTALETARESDNSNRANLARIEAALESERQLGNQLERQLADERQLSALLRRQLDTQQRLLMENSTQLDHLRAVARESNARVEASLERVFQRQLASEEQFLQQRSRELQEQMTAGEQYALRLTRERNRLIMANPERATELQPVYPIERNSPDARSTTLPTTLRADSLSSVLSEHSESRNQRIQHIDHLQRQVRRAESRVALATADIQALENAIRREFGRQEQSDVDSLPRRPGDWNTPPASWRTGLNPSERNRAAAAAAAARRAHDRGSQTLADLASRIPDSDLRLARMMFLSGMSGNRATDANGNWTPGAGLNRVLAGASSLTAREPPATTTAADAVREMGPGTAGIGFSPDGQYLFAGSEEGIYEFKINLRDRMTFPAVEFR